MPYLRKSEIKVNEIYWHWQHMNYSKEHVLSNYVVPEKTYVQSRQYSMENLVENLETLQFMHQNQSIKIGNILN